MAEVLGANLPADILEAIAIFGVPARVAIIRHLTAAGPQTRGQLAQALSVKANTIQKNLEVLRRAGVIHADRLDYPDGAHHRIEYRVDGAVAQGLMRRLAEVVVHRA